MSLVALVRPTGPELAACELTHLDRQPIDIERATAEHDGYVEHLRHLGVDVVELPRLAHHPDAVFVEDTALVLDELAVLLRPGAPSRQGEVASVGAALADHRQVVELPGTATLDGGDIIVAGRRVLIGVTSRSSREAGEALRRLLEPHGYRIESVDVAGVLHLKSATTALDDETLVVSPAHVDLRDRGFRLVAVPPQEPHGANTLSIGATVLVDAAAPRTAGLLDRHGYQVDTLAVGEFSKAEGALTCKSLVFRRHPVGRRGPPAGA